MSDFRVFRNRSASAEPYPFLLDVQSDLLSALDTRLVIPLLRTEHLEGRSIKNLNPVVRVNHADYFAMTQQMAAVPKGLLGEAVEEAEFSRGEVLSSIDFLVTGL